MLTEKKKKRAGLTLRRGWDALKNYQPDSFHPLVLHGILYTFFADEYTCTYATNYKTQFFQNIYNVYYVFWYWDVHMPSATITVRFDKILYKKIKGHWMCTSDLVRNAVRMYLEHLEEEEQKAEDPLISPALQEEYYVNTPVKHDVLQEMQVEKQEYNQDLQTLKYQEETDNNYQGSEDETSMLIKKLKREMDELDSELNQLKSKYAD